MERKWRQHGLGDEVWMRGLAKLLALHYLSVAVCEERFPGSTRNTRAAAYPWEICLEQTDTSVLLSYLMTSSYILLLFA